MVLCILVIIILYVNVTTDGMQPAAVSTPVTANTFNDINVLTNLSIGKYNVSPNNGTDPEKRHIAFLKVHKAASSTVQNILYRFGSQRELSFVLPYTSHYISQHNAKTYNRVLPPFDNDTGKYDILCNHVMFNHTKFKQLMYDDAVYLAIVREPLDLFVSAAYYYKYTWPAKYLKILNDSTFIHDLITKPEEYEHPNINQSRTFNYMAVDFGFTINSIQDVVDLSETDLLLFVSDLMDTFHFVMVVEYFDESLVMMKRILNWSTKDILYIKRNEFKQRRGLPDTHIHVSEEDKLMFKKRNRVDYAIYESFLDLFLKRKSEAAELDDEVDEFRNTLQAVKEFCTKNQSVQKIVFPATKWNFVYSVGKRECDLMMTNELPFWKSLVQKHVQHLKK